MMTVETVAQALGVPLERWVASGRGVLAAALAGSEAVARYVGARPELALPLVRGELVQERKSAAVMRDELRARRAGARTDEELAAALAEYRVREWTRIVGRELARACEVETTLAELSDLALAIIDTAARWHLRRERSQKGPRHELTGAGLRPAGFAVLAQGKLGGGELNVSSDIDVQFVYSSDEAPEDASRSLHERYVAIARKITAALSSREGFGFAYRVDADLRPEGKKGPLANSLAGIERYYESFGQTWERLALIRAAHGGGARWVTDELLGIVRPFVFPRSVSPQAVEEIRRLKDRLHEERRVAAVARGRAGVDVKRDPGCIRDVELFVQVLQLLQGGREPALRIANILTALERLRFAGHLSSDEHETLARGYRFLRRLENALQARHEQQTHLLPREPEERQAIALMLGLRGEHAGKRLGVLLAKERRAIAKVTARLFGGRPAEPLALLPQEPAERTRLLQRLGFAAPEEATQVLGALSATAHGPFSEHAQERTRRLGAALLGELARSPSPDQALRLSANLDSSLRRRPAYYGLLEDPALRRRLADLLGSSEFLGLALASYPELIDRLAEMRDPEAYARGPGVAGLLDTALARLRSVGDLELGLRSLRRLKLEELLRIGVLDLAGVLDIEAVVQQLSELAEALLRAALELARQSLRGAFAQGFVILGLGRLGSAEVGYGSDLDLLFVFEEGAHGSREQAVSLAQRLVRQISYSLEEGPLYAIDTRLRPSGHQGPLVSSAAGFVQYQREHAALWEHQALVRARPVAGDLGLGARVLAEVDAVRYPAALPPAAAESIHAMRRRMEEERTRGTALDLKLSAGGITDVEFLVQYLVLRHAATRPALRVPGTLAGLRAAVLAGLVPSERGRMLEEAYRFLRLVENRLRMASDRAVSEVGRSEGELAALARRLGEGQGRGAGARLERRLEVTMRRVRRAFRATLGVR